MYCNLRYFLTLVIIFEVNLLVSAGWSYRGSSGNAILHLASLSRLRLSA